MLPAAETSGVRRLDQVFSRPTKATVSEKQLHA